MTLEQQKQIEREFQDAKTPEEITKAQTHAILALVDCQRKTGERVKRLTWKLFAEADNGHQVLAMSIGNNVTVTPLFLNAGDVVLLEITNNPLSYVQYSAFYTD